MTEDVAKPTLRDRLGAMDDETILEYCDLLTDDDPITLLREVIPFLVHERSQYAEVAMMHQCTPDYEAGQLNGEAATIHVCRQRYGKCLHDG